jgi:hypothetical protein
MNILHFSLGFSLDQWSPELDALFGGLVGLLIEAGLFSGPYSVLQEKILNKGHLGELTWPEWLNVRPWMVITPVAIGIIALPLWIEEVRPWVF